MKRSDTFSFSKKSERTKSVLSRNNSDRKMEPLNAFELPPEFTDILETLELKEILKQTSVNTGQSLAELSQNHRVLLFTIKWFGNSSCNEMIEKITEHFQSMLETNTIPVIGHQQSQKSLNQFIQNSKNQIVKKLLYTKIEKNFRNVLGLYDTNIKEHLKVVGDGIKSALQKTKSFQVPSDVISSLTCYGIFSIEDSNITKELKWEDFSKKINLHKIMYDLSLPKSVLPEEEFVTRIGKLFNLDGDLLKRTYKAYKKKQLDIEKGVTEVKSLLEDESKRVYFKKFAKSEFSDETIMFYEDVLAYKMIIDINKKTSVAEKIIKNYLQDKSVHQVNTSSKLINPIKEQLLKFAFYQIQNTKEDLILQNEIFDDVMDDIIFNQISDSFYRFKKSDFYKEMEDKYTDVSYLI